MVASARRDRRNSKVAEVVRRKRCERSFDAREISLGRISCRRRRRWRRSCRRRMPRDLATPGERLGCVRATVPCRISRVRRVRRSWTPRRSVFLCPSRDSRPPSCWWSRYRIASYDCKNGLEVRRDSRNSEENRRDCREFERFRNPWTRGLVGYLVPWTRVERSRHD